MASSRLMFNTEIDMYIKRYSCRISCGFTYRMAPSNVQMLDHRSFKIYCPL